MDVATTHMLDATRIYVRSDDLLDCCAFQQLDILVGVDRAEFVEPAAQRFHLPLVIGEITIAAAEVGIDVILGYAIANDAGAEIRDLEQHFQPLGADMLLHRVQVVADPGHHLPAVAAGSTIA